MAQITLSEVGTKLERWMKMLEAGPQSVIQSIATEMHNMAHDIARQTAAPSDKHAHWGRRTVAVDFDGVLHSYITPWTDSAEINDPPLPGAIEWLAKLTVDFQVVIFSARCNDDRGIRAMQEWFIKWGLPHDVHDKIRYEPGKPSAWVFIDDRSIQFTGSFWQISSGQLKKFTPWYYEQEEWNRKGKGKKS